MPDISIDLGPLHSHLNQLEQHIHVVNSNLGVVDGKVEQVAYEQRLAKDKLEGLYEEFRTFVAADQKAKNKQYAATELVRAQQDLEQKYGYYAQLRRTALGILQAADLELVRQDIMHSATEKLMLEAPKYWLAPVLVGLTAWIKDDRPLAEKAMAAGISRDDSRTSLFFSLVCRRARRMEAATRWLSRYFQIQNPTAMDREVVVMLDGLANGVFGGGALIACSTVIEQWLAELEEQAGFLDEQRKRWADRLDVMAPRIADTDYPTLRKYSPASAQLAAALSAARRNQVVHGFFSTLFAGELVVSPTIEGAVDGLLESLVSNYDDEELPLRREKRMLELIKEEDGDKDVARKRYDAEFEAFEEKTNFAALLTSSAMNPEQLGATRATQRYAVSRCRQWIMAAHADLVARDRSKMPRQVPLEIASWKGSSVDGSNQQNLVADLSQHYAKKIEQALEDVKLGAGTWIALIAGVLIGILFMTAGKAAILFGLIVAGAAIAYFAWKYKDLDRVRDNTRQTLEHEHKQVEYILTASLAELADYRREVAAEDAKSEGVTQFLESLSAPQYVLQRPEQRVSVA